MQLGLLLLVVHRFGVEENRGLLTLSPLVFFGFLVHARLPMAWRRPFFLALSLAGFALVLEPVSAAALVGIGLGLIGICHLPVPWALRIALLLGCGAVLTAMRADWLAAPWARPMLPILGSIFMFRLVLYVYELRTEAARVPIWQRLSYFFLLPNALFPLFPIVDYKTFRRTDYDAPANDIYQKGVHWMLRGVIQLLLYRVIYQNFTPAAEDVHDGGTLVLYMVSSYALYLRVSGLFHLIVGMLCLFGFNLPETHHHYFLATGFNDLWRRINIYWKDFMMKIVYYPIFIRLRRRNATTAMVVATVSVFLVSWWLHSYQWFWVRSTFPLTMVDAIFWSIFAVTVLANSLLQSKRGSGRTLGKRSVTARAALVHALKVVSMFSFMCVLWSFWTASGADAWLEMLAASTRGPASQFLGIAAGLVGAVVVGTLFQLVVQPTLARLGEGATFGRGVAVNGVVMAALLVLGTPEISGLESNALVRSVRHEGLSQRDRDLMLRGYYEEILEADRALGGLWELQVEKPKRWVRLAETDAVRRTEDRVLERELVPRTELKFRGAMLRTNAHGLRDRDYALEKPPGTYRLALMGASIEMGSGVENEEVFEVVTERLLNEANSGESYDAYELVNFSVNGYTPLSQVAQHDKVLTFSPDAVLFFAHPVDDRLLRRHVERLIEEDVPIPYPRLVEVIERAGLVAGMPTAESQAAYQRHRDEFLAWAYTEIVRRSRQNGARPVWVYLQHPPNPSPERVARGERMRELASAAGFTTLVLDEKRVFPPHRDWTKLIVRPWDHHPNERGHKLIARELFRQLKQNQRKLALGLTYAEERVR